MKEPLCPLGTFRQKFSASRLPSCIVPPPPPCLRIAVLTMFSAPILRFPTDPALRQLHHRRVTHSRVQFSLRDGSSVSQNDEAADMLIKITSSRFGISFEWDYPQKRTDVLGRRKREPRDERTLSRNAEGATSLSVHRRRLGLSSAGKR